MSDAVHRIEFTRRAERDLRALPPDVRGRLSSRIDALGTDPRPRGARKLADRDEIYRVRVGALRILYEIQAGALVVLVVRVGHRRGMFR